VGKKQSLEQVAEPVEIARPTLNSYLARFELDGLRDTKPLNADHGTRSRLLDAAITLFASQGFNACSMREIAKAVNIGAPAIYNHYASKTEILVAAIDSVLCTFYSALFTDPIPKQAEAALYCILRRHVIFCVEKRAFARAADALLNPELMSRELAEQHQGRYTAAMRVYRDILRELIGGVQGDVVNVDVDLQAFLVHEIVDRAGEWYEPDSAMDAEVLADQSLAAVKRMLTLPKQRKANS
jgi:AcrR family transcriptional regulator